MKLHTGKSLIFVAAAIGIGSSNTLATEAVHADLDRYEDVAFFSYKGCRDNLLRVRDWLQQPNPHLWDESLDKCIATSKQEMEKVYSGANSCSNGEIGRLAFSNFHQANLILLNSLKPAPGEDPDKHDKRLKLALAQVNKTRSIWEKECYSTSPIEKGESI